MSKSARLIFAVFGVLIGIGLIVGGGVGLLGSRSTVSSEAEVRAQLRDSGISLGSTSVAVLVRSSKHEPVVTDIGPIVSKLRQVPTIKSADPVGSLFNSDKTAGVIGVTLDPKTDDRTARTVVSEALRNIDLPDGLTVSVPGPSDQSSWRVPAAWLALAFGAIAVFATGGIAFAAPHSSNPTPHMAEAPRRQRMMLFIGGLLSLAGLAALLSAFAALEIEPSGITKALSGVFLLSAASCFGGAVRIKRDAVRNS